MAIALPLNRLVDRARVIGTIGREGGHPIVDLVQETGDPRTVCRASMGQVRGKDFARVCIHRQVEFPLNPEPCTNAFFR
jgi:hypothetical protein